MKIVGLTGGMGVGKSTVAEIFKEKGYSIYGSDVRAKELMEEDLGLKKALIGLLGDEAYTGEKLNRAFVASKIFSDKELLRKQNEWVHQAVKTDFENWVSVQKGNFCIKEAAILFESGSYKNCDYTIVVTAPEEIRIQRILSRDRTSEEEVKKRLQNQWPQEKLVELSDFQIINDSDVENLRKQVGRLIVQLEKLSV